MKDNKRVILTVGSPGSGKSTWAKSQENSIYISQDEQGQKRHLELFKESLNRGDKKIIVDRTGYSREQRYRYLSLAKDAGYQTRIHEFYEPYKTCFNRIINRKNHPTINVGDTITAQKALDMYFEKYEQIHDNEANIIVRSNSNPKVLDLTEDFRRARKTFVVGDLHGCFSELMTLLKRVGYDEDKDLLLSCGDLVDRGPEIYECLEFFTNHPNRKVVCGNHDSKFLRYLRGNKVNTKSIAKTIEQCDGKIDYIDMMNNFCHSIIKFGNNYITHAGFNPNKHPEHTTKEFSLYARKFDEALQTFTNNDNAKYWYEYPRKYPEYNLFFGHEVHVDKCEVAKGIYAMDAGCVFGNKLRIATVTFDEGVVRIDEMDSFQPKTEQDKEWDFINKFEPYEKLVESKYLNKQEMGDLVLYNYSDLTTFSREWNKYTIESRGLILNKVNGETVARPFSKFMNATELLAENEINKILNDKKK